MLDLVGVVLEWVGLTGTRRRALVAIVLTLLMATGAVVVALLAS